MDGVCWWNPRPREKKKTKRCASPTWGPLPEEFESMGGPRSSLGFPSMRPIQLIIFFVAVMEGRDSYHYVWCIHTGSGSRGQNHYVSSCSLCCKQEALGPGSRWLFEKLGPSHY